MLKVNVASDQEGSYEVEQRGKDWLINDVVFDGDVQKLSENRYHVIWNARSYSVEVLESNTAEKHFQILINGKTFKTSAKTDIDLLLEGMGLHAQASKKINHIKAPMPGLIQSVAVVAGDRVEKGTILLVLVAMKMENVIKASGEGIVKSLKVSPGETVEKNQVMLEFE